MRLRTADRRALALLCLLLVASVSARIYAYKATPPGSELAVNSAVVELGEGVSLQRTDAVGQLMSVASCPAPVTVDFVEPSPHGRDTSLAAAPNPNDRVFYVYQGWTLEGPRAAMKLGGLYFLRRAGAVLGIGSAGIRNELAVKIIVPAGCDALPEDVMAILRLSLPLPTPSSAPTLAPRF